jgi:thioredoxin reductase/NAD-dependent dihydropyrimidine dehydrogenase PreA subunit
MSSYAFVAFLSVLVALVYALWSHYDGRRERALQREIEQVSGLGDLLPPTLHPVIDPARCIGSGACVTACPEHQVIGLIKGRAQLINPMSCIGHGACAAACPAQAIRLVFGTQSRGLELPRMDRHFQTNQRGIYIAGELGGMGLIRNAVVQGAQAAAHIITGSDKQQPLRGKNGAYDALVVGAGPAGISATLRLMEGGLNVLLVDQETFGGTILHYPRAKVVMTGDLPLPLVGTLKRRTMTRERLVELCADIQKRFNVPFKSHELVQSVAEAPDGMWVVRSQTSEFRTANVVLALGTRGSPRRLGVLGEELPKVHYRLLEPQEFAAKHALVVGGGNSAVESALSLSDFGGCSSVTISYRRDQFLRCRSDNRRRIDEAIQRGAVRALMSTNIVRIEPKSVTLSNGGSGPHVIDNDAIIAQLGGTAPAEVLKSFGIALVTKYGEQ